MIKNELKLIIIGFSALVNIGCDNLDENLNTTTPYVSTEVRAIVATVASDYSSSAVSVITGDADRIAYNQLLSSTNSDRTATTFNNKIYLIERFSGTNVAKFSLNDITTPEWQYTTQDSPDDAVSSNPQQIVFASETKAYIMRYGSNNIWIVNPSATTSESFKIGEIDLSAYADADGLAEINMGVIANGKLYVAIQRLEYYDAINTAYLAIIDTATDLEVDANIAGDTLMGIPLTIKNPNNSIQYLAANNSLYVQGIGTYSTTEFTGGIERINLTDYSSSLIIDDGTAALHANEKVSAMTVISPTVGYYISYISWGTTSVYKFNPTTGAENQTTIAALISGDFSDITADANGLIWLSDVSNATVQVIDPITDTLVDSIATSLNPQKISFVN